nr:uncharacterized protein LOC108007701 [Drosophila suzukii]
MIRLQNVCQWGKGKNSCTSSRRKILAWVNDNLNTSFMRLEDLCSGVQYCQMLHKLRPSAINLKKVRVNTRAQHEYVRNMKLLQRSLLKQGIEKQIPILRLVARGYRETLEFSRWFKAFYDRNYILLQDEIAQDKKNRVLVLKDTSMAKRSAKRVNSKFALLPSQDASSQYISQISFGTKYSREYSKDFRSHGKSWMCSKRRSHSNHSNWMEKNSYDRYKYSREGTYVSPLNAKCTICEKGRRTVKHIWNRRKESAFSRFRQKELFGSRRSTPNVNYSHLRNLNSFGIAPWAYTLIDQADRNKKGTRLIHSKVGNVMIKLTPGKYPVFNKIFDKKYRILKSAFVCGCFIKRRSYARAKPRTSIEELHPIDLPDQQENPQPDQLRNSETISSPMIKDSATDLFTQMLLSDGSVVDNLNVDKEDLRKEIQLTALLEISPNQEDKSCLRKDSHGAPDKEEIDLCLEILDNPSSIEAYPSDLVIGCSSYPPLMSDVINSKENVRIFNLQNDQSVVHSPVQSKWESANITKERKRNCRRYRSTNRFAIQKLSKNIRKVLRSPLSERLPTQSQVFDKHLQLEVQSDNLSTIQKSAVECETSPGSTKENFSTFLPICDGSSLYDSSSSKAKEYLFEMVELIERFRSHFIEYSKRLRNDIDSVKLEIIFLNVQYQQSKQLYDTHNFGFNKSGSTEDELEQTEAAVVEYVEPEKKFSSSIWNFHFEKSGLFNDLDGKPIRKLWGQKFCNKIFIKHAFRAASGGVRKTKHIINGKTRKLEYWIRQGIIAISPISMHEDFSADNNLSTEEDIDDEIALIMKNVRNKLEEVQRIRRMWSSKGLEN